MIDRTLGGRCAVRKTAAASIIADREGAIVQVDAPDAACVGVEVDLAWSLWLQVLSRASHPLPSVAHDQRLAPGIWVGTDSRLPERACARLSVAPTSGELGEVGIYVTNELRDDLREALISIETASRGVRLVEHVGGAHG